MEASCMATKIKILKELQASLSPFLQRHSQQVSEYSAMLAIAAWNAEIYRDDPCFTPRFLELIGTAAFWHDIGKAEISNELWELPRPLTSQEYALVKTHPVLGAATLVEKVELISGKKVDTLHNMEIELTKDACLYHHEYWNGSGYPCGYAGAEIPLAGRMVAIADAYDSMTAKRPYAEEKSAENALAEIRRCAGTQFDPLLAVIFIGEMEKSIEVKSSACV